jgi:hypothetical protein
MDENPVRHVFFSAHHPGGRSKPAIAGAALVRPLGFCMLPVMLGALVSMLQGFDALPYLTVGFPIAGACATAWTWIKVRGDVCEIHIHDNSVAVRSMMDAALPASNLNWKRLIHLESEGSHADLTLGLSSLRLSQSDWPEWTHILSALRHASTTG